MRIIRKKSIRRRVGSNECWPALANKQAGLTIIETVMVVSITVFILMALVRFIVAGYPLSKTAYLQARSTETARLQLKRLVKIIREARQSDTGSYPLVEIGPQKLVFYSDVDADEVTERIRLELNGTQLVKGTLEPTGSPLQYNQDNEIESVIMSYVQNGGDPIFTYYAGDYPFSETPLDSDSIGDVKYIQFNLTVDVDPAIDPPAVEVVSQVQLRNLKTNLGQTVE